MQRLRRAGVFGLALAACGGNGSEPGAPAAPTVPSTSSGMSSAALGPTASIFVVPAKLADLDGVTFFDQPWPSDLRMEAGAVRFAGYYNPKAVPTIDDFVLAMNGALDGFSPIASGFMRFTGSIDPASLPATPTDALDLASALQLIDVDPASPEYGHRKLVSWMFRDSEGVYWREHTLAFMPTLGFPLRPHTRYAVVVTDRLKAPGGAPVVASDDLRATLGLTTPAGPIVAAHDAFAPAVAEVEALGLARAHIVHFTAFTTTDPTSELFAARDDLRKNVGVPSAHAADWSAEGSTANSDEYLGVYGPSPNYQDGQIPFRAYGDGGAFKIQDGHPTSVNLFDLRFSLTVPNAGLCPMPVAGYPIVLYAHGTGGDYRSYVKDGTGEALAQRCLATMGIDQIFHGARPGAPSMSLSATQIEQQEELLYYNFENVVAARYNARQAALDEVQRARLFTETHATVPPSVSKTGAAILFDPAKVLFFGHSQGGHNGPLYFASDDSARGGVLSGSGAVLSITLLEKTLPAPSVAGLVQTFFLELSGDDIQEVSVFHPAISLAQTIVDGVDRANYARFSIASPRSGFAPKSIYMTEGIDPDGTGDEYAPPHGIEMHALSLGLPLELPDERAIAEEQWGGPTPTTVPAAGLSGNLAAGSASGILAQWAVPPGRDGHFVVFDVPAARAQAAEFCKNLAADPKGKVPPSNAN